MKLFLYQLLGNLKKELQSDRQFLRCYYTFAIPGITFENDLVTKAFQKPIKIYCTHSYTILKHMFVSIINIYILIGVVKVYLSCFTRGCQILEVGQD